MQHWDDADGEVAGNTATDLEHAERILFGRPSIELCEPRHVFNAGSNGMNILHITADHSCGVHIAECGILPAGNDHGKVLLGSRQHP